MRPLAAATVVSLLTKEQWTDLVGNTRMGVMAEIDASDPYYFSALAAAVVRASSDLYGWERRQRDAVCAIAAEAARRAEDADRGAAALIREDCDAA